jgi:glycosyltransferase involved in cell wall biosynthesis
MPEVMRAADVFVSASRVEGMSNAVLEAASIGLPIAAFAIPGIVETSEGLAGCGFFLAEPSSGAKGLRASILQALEGPVGPAWHRKRAELLRRYSVEHVAEEWNSLLSGGLGRRLIDDHTWPS